MPVLVLAYCKPGGRPQERVAGGHEESENEMAHCTSENEGKRALEFSVDFALVFHLLEDLCVHFR